MKEHVQQNYNFFRSMDETKTWPDKENLQKISINPRSDVEVLLDNTKEIRPRELFTKLQQDRITFKESILLLDYVFQKLLSPARNDFFTAQEHVDRSAYFCDADMEAEILGSIYREEEGPYGFSSSKTSCYEYTYYTYSCNEEQYKNRLRLKAFLDTVKDFGLLETPIIKE